MTDLKVQLKACKTLEKDVICNEEADMDRCLGLMLTELGSKTAPPTTPPRFKRQAALSLVKGQKVRQRYEHGDSHKQEAAWKSGLS